MRPYPYGRRQVRTDMTPTSVHRHPYGVHPYGVTRDVRKGIYHIRIQSSVQCTSSRPYASNSYPYRVNYNNIRTKSTQRPYQAHSHPYQVPRLVIRRVSIITSVRCNSCYIRTLFSCYIRTLYIHVRKMFNIPMSVCSVTTHP